MIRRGLSIAFLLISTMVWSQLEQPSRFEVPIQSMVDSYDVIPCEEKGIVIWRSSVNLVTKNTFIEVSLLDTALNVALNRTFIIYEDLSYISSKYSNGNVFLLFREFSVNKKNLRLIQVDIETGEAQQHIIPNIIPFNFFDMILTEEAIVIAGYLNYRPIAFLFNFYERIPRILPGFFNERAELDQMVVNDNGQFDIVISRENDERINTVFIHSFDNKGNAIDIVELEASRKKALLFGRIEAIDSERKLLAGVYGRRNSEYSWGIFLGYLNERSKPELNFYNYAEFENFFDYMRPRRESRIKKRIKRKKEKDRRIRFNYRLLVHDIIEYQDEFILIGEAFYPKYKYVQQGSGSLRNAMGGFRYQRIFEGYEYTHSVVIGFDNKGKVLWDNSFKIQDVLTRKLEQLTHVSSNNDVINMFYIFENEIRNKIISKSEVLEGSKVIELKMLYKGDVLKGQSQIQGLERWYGNVFVTYGTQWIKNTSLKNTATNRHVFFINKVVPE